MFHHSESENSTAPVNDETVKHSLVSFFLCSFK